jgi:hypothetical protein
MRRSSVLTLPPQLVFPALGPCTNKHYFIWDYLNKRVFVKGGLKGFRKGATTLRIMTFSVTTFSIMTCSITAFDIMTFSIMTFSITTLGITAFRIMTFSKMTFSITTFSITTFGIKTFSITTLNTVAGFVMLIVVYAECH